MNNYKRITAYSAIAVTTTFNCFGGWLDVQPAYNFDDEYGTVRLEGGSQITDKLSHYGFLDLNGTPAAEWDFDGYFTEQTFRYDISDLGSAFEGWSATAEVDAGNGFKDVYRFGLSWGKSLWEGNYTGIKILPLASRDDNGLYNIFVSQQFTDAFSMYGMIDYGLGEWIFGEEQIYVEIEARYKLDDRYSLFAQGREFTVADGYSPDLSYLAGVKISF